MSFASISGIVFAYVDSIMLGILLPAEYVGIYRAAYNVVFAFIGIISIAFVLFPIFTQLDGLELENAFKRVFRYSSILVFPITFGLIFFAEPVVRIVYGVDYMPSVTPMYALSILIILTPLDFFGILFTAKGKPEFPAKLMIVSSAINIILNYIFIVNLGVLGAAIATVVSRSFNIVILGILSKRILNIAPNLDSIYKPLFSSAIMGLFLYLVPAPSTFLLSIFEILVGVFIYLTTLILLRGLMREDLVFLIETIR
jgi:O-antigen/teichoic acid export membrane protein